MYCKKVLISRLGERDMLDIFPWENPCLMGKDRVYRELDLHTTLSECICGLKEGDLSPSPSRGGQISQLVSRFLQPEITWRWPDYFFFPWRPHSCLSICLLSEISLSEWLYSILCSLDHPFEIVMHSEHFNILIILLSSLCTYNEDWFAHFYSKSHLHGKLG